VSGLLDRMAKALAGSPLADALGTAAERFAERRGGDDAAADLDEGVLRGLARVVATQPDTAIYLSNRPEWLEIAAGLAQRGLAARAEEIAGEELEILDLDLESALDALRLRRRDEMALAACADLGELAPFDAVSDSLSRLAESTARTALALAQREVSGPDLGGDFAVVGMGKVAGREFTYHSDLDLIFLFRGGTDEIDRATRIGQRMIAYLTTQTGAGVAYAVDTRLRPSGQQGMLVTSFEGYERYQTEQAATWEHLAMLRARPIAGAIGEAAERLARVRKRVLPAAQPPWSELAELRQRVVAERAAGDDGVRALKTGPGGLMDVDFCAGGGLLERGATPYPDPPGVPAMLEAAAGPEAAAGLLADYALLRRVEARARWVAGRGLEELPAELEVIAELVEAGLTGAGLRKRVAELRTRIREAYDRVIAAGTIAALKG